MVDVAPSTMSVQTQKKAPLELGVASGEQGDYGKNQHRGAHGRFSEGGH